MTIDYTYYTDEYLGNVIKETDFPRLIKRAKDKVNYLCFGRIDLIDDDCAIVGKVKDAICAVAEKMMDVDIANETIRRNGGMAVSSISSGSESISYASNSNADVISAAEMDKAYYYTAREYLSGTGLLYAGF